jgi:hypothetical protein
VRVISKRNSFYCKHTSFERHAPIEIPLSCPKEKNTGERESAAGFILQAFFCNVNVNIKFFCIAAGSFGLFEARKTK